MLPRNELQKVSTFAFLVLGDVKKVKELLNKTYSFFYKASQVKDYSDFSSEFIQYLVRELKVSHKKKSYESFKRNWLGFFDVAIENSTPLISTSYKILTELSKEEKLCLLLKDIFCFEEREIAEMMNTSEGTVNLRLNQSILNLARPNEVSG